MVHVYISDTKSNGFQRIGSTEIVKSTSKAVFLQKPELEFHFWEQQLLRFDLVNAENEKVSDFLGKVFFILFLFVLFLFYFYVYFHYFRFLFGFFVD
jgi:hypothetical protein